MGLLVFRTICVARHCKREMEDESFLGDSYLGSVIVTNVNLEKVRLLCPMELFL